METADAYRHMEFEEFQQLKTTQELHQLATQCFFYIQQWIVESPLCSEATALMLFWNNYPFEAIRRSWKTKKETDENFDIVKTVINNFEKGFYTKTAISYDPSEKIAQAPKIPTSVLQTSVGEEPYIYLDAQEVQSWFGEHLNNQIIRCDSTIELYNIAVSLKHRECEVYKTITEHRCCDKAIALMVYWLLERYSTLNRYAEDWLQIKPILDNIVYKLDRKEYLEVLNYDPVKEVNPIKWEIPSYLFNRIN